MTVWCHWLLLLLLLLQDLAGQPQQMGDGTLRTPGVIDFFRMLNEQVDIWGFGLWVWGFGACRLPT